MKHTVIRYNANQLNQEEKASGYRYPGEIVAAAEWKTEKKKGSLGTAIPQEPKAKRIAHNIPQTQTKSKRG